MKSELAKIEDIKLNPSNPRVIKDNKFKKLVKSIKDFPKMLEIRPIVVNDDMIVLGGNMRLKACTEAGIKEIPIIKVSDLSLEQQREFIIKDNVGYGEWDWTMLNQEWDEVELDEWGVDVIKHDWNDLDYIEEQQALPETNKDNLIMVVLDTAWVSNRKDIEAALNQFLSTNYSGCACK
jgi:ParB-like chromosome segregation protein Spo0J